jgi:hypothetical protein
MASFNNSLGLSLVSDLTSEHFASGSNDFTLGINPSNSSFNDYYKQNSLNNRLEARQDTRNEFNLSRGIAVNNNTGQQVNCPSQEIMNQCQCMNGQCKLPGGGLCNFHEKCGKPMNCSNCGKETTQAPSNSNTPSAAASNTNTPSAAASNTNTPSAASNSFEMDIPEKIMADPELLAAFLQGISESITETTGAKVINTSIVENQPQPTTSQITTNTITENVYQSSNSVVNNNNIEQNISIILGATRADIVILLSKLMSVNLDNRNNASLLNLAKGIKQFVIESGMFSNEEELYKEIENNRNGNLSSSFLNKLRTSKPEIYTKLFGNNAPNTTEKPKFQYNTSFIPGFQYTPPDLWPTQQYKPPVCIQDKKQVSSPAFVFGSGTPVNALDYESLKLLPTFTYYENQAGSESQEFLAKQKLADEFCNKNCVDDCTSPFCSALNCPNCRQ